MSCEPLYTICFPQIDDQQKEEESQIHQKYDKLVSALPQSLQGHVTRYLYKGFWFANGSFGIKALTGMLVAQEYFQARPNDIILATLPKAGTTWLKALTFAILNRTNKPYPKSLLLSLNPHQCVPFLEVHLYCDNRIPNLDVLPSPRLLATHIPYSLLPPSILKCETCKVVYLCRNPKDALISMWKFVNTTRKPNDSSSLEEYTETFLSGVHPSGPYWDNVMEYWKASIDMPNKVLFLKYEDLKRDTHLQLKRIAKFIGHGFSEGEEKEGVVEEIVKMCSLQSLRDLEVNQTTCTKSGDFQFQNKAFFRKGEVGNYAKYMSPQMIEQLDQVTKEKFKDTGLSFE